MFMCWSLPIHDRAVQKELEGQDITLLVDGGLKTKEDIGERVSNSRPRAIRKFPI